MSLETKKILIALFTLTLTILVYVTLVGVLIDISQWLFIHPLQQVLFTVAMSVLLAAALLILIGGLANSTKAKTEAGRKRYDEDGRR